MTDQDTQAVVPQFRLTFLTTYSPSILNIKFGSGIEIIALPNSMFVQLDASRAQFYQSETIPDSLLISPTTVLVTAMTGALNLTLFFSVEGSSLNGSFWDSSNLGGVTLIVTNSNTGKQQTVNNSGQFDLAL